jgi:hypothetical protein
VTEPLDDGGCVVTITDDVFNDTDPQQRRVGDALREALSPYQL